MQAETTFKAFEILRGELSEAEKDRIFELADEPFSYGAYRIARAIKRHPSTVAWFMYRSGLRKLSKSQRAPYTRLGRSVVPFSKEEDAYIVDRRSGGETFAAIARTMKGIFYTERTGESVGMRIVMLASDETASETA